MGGFLGSLTGSNTEGKLKAQRAEITKGRDQAKDQYTQGEGTAQGYMQPYVQGGQQFYDTYKNALLGGNNDWYHNNDALQESRRLDLLRQARASNAAGQYAGVDGSRSGPGALADARVNAENYYRALGLLQGGAAAGQNAAGNAAGIAQWGASGRAGADMNAANGLAQSYGESAKNSNTFAQNLLGLGGLAVQAYTGMPKPKTGNNIG